MIILLFSLFKLYTKINRIPDKSHNFKYVKLGSIINLEKSLKHGSKISGHYVQGHIDTVIECVNIYDQKGSWIFEFEYSEEYAKYVVPKGSISINGVSLTIADIQDDQNCFTVAIIPYTFKHTNFQSIKKGDYVNIEFDILTKKIIRLSEKK